MADIDRKLGFGDVLKDEFHFLIVLLILEFLFFNIFFASNELKEKSTYVHIYAEMK